MLQNFVTENKTVTDAQKLSLIHIYTYLAGNEYPGRGICIGRSPDGTKACLLYTSRCV